MNYVLKLLDNDFRERDGFQYPTEVGAVVTCPDWDTNLECGNGLHGYLNGVGDLSATTFREKAMILTVEYYLDLGGKIKFEKATVFAYGEVYEITSLLRTLVGNKAINLTSLSTKESVGWVAGDESTLTVRGETVFIIKKGEKCILNMFYRNRCITKKLDTMLKKFKIGDVIKIVEGKVTDMDIQ